MYTKSPRILIISLCFIALFNSLFAQKITISNLEFRVGNERIWLNGANTPWNNWNDFGGDFDRSWWENEFQRLKNKGINSVRIWFSCSGEIDPMINTNGYVTGPSAKFWADCDQLFELATQKGIYVMATMMSFDHTKEQYTTYQSWRDMINSEANTESYIDNYIIPFVNRYKSNPYLFSIDTCNEIEWINNNSDAGQLSWPNLQRLVGRTAMAVHKNSDILVTMGSAAIDWNSDRFRKNYWSDSELQSVNQGDTDAYLDFYQVHYYEWQYSFLNSPFDQSPSDYQINDRPVIIGECPGVDMPEIPMTIDNAIEAAYNLGYQGTFPWSSNGIDEQGSLETFGDATYAFASNHPELIDVPDVTVTTPAIPSSLSGNIVSVVNINLSWNDNSNNENGFRIERKEGQGDFHLIALEASSVENYTDRDNIRPGNTYTYRVSAYNGGGQSNFTQELIITIPSSSTVVQENPLISHGKPIFSSNGNVDILTNDILQEYSWEYSPGVWAAIEIGQGPENVLIHMNSPYYSWSDDILTSGFCGQGEYINYTINYDILTSSNSTNGVDGDWTVARSISGNNVTTRSHAIPFTGMSWVKIDFQQGSGSLDEIEVFDITNGSDDTWFFLGDSITANAFKGDNTEPSFAKLIYSYSNNVNRPMVMRAGIPCIRTDNIVPHINDYLTYGSDAKYWGILLGTNDAWGGSDEYVSTYKSNMQQIIDAILAVGKIPVLGRIPATDPNVVDGNWQVHPGYLQAIEELRTENNLLVGPDFYTWFLNNPNELADGVHPTNIGAQSMQRLWAETAFNNSVLSIDDEIKDKKNLVITYKTNNINIISHNNIKIKKIMIYTILGQVLLTKAVSDISMNIPILLKKGQISIIKVELENGEVVTQKFLKK